jgi:hypothetical protein
MLKLCASRLVATILLLMYTLYFTVSALLVLTDAFQITVAVVAILLLTVAEKAPNESGGGTILFMDSFFLQEKNKIIPKTTNRLILFFIVFFANVKYFYLVEFRK